MEKLSPISAGVSVGQITGTRSAPMGHEMKQVLNSGSAPFYSIYYLDTGPGDRADSEVGMENLRRLFPDGEADDMNFVLFSTSGVHGTYTTIEEIEKGLLKYGDDYLVPSGEDGPDDWHGHDLTVLVVHPRIVCLRCGNVRVRLSDVPYLKKLRDSSLSAVGEIGLPWR